MALEFDGTSQYVDCGNNSSLNITEGTWMSWIKIPESSAYERVVHKYTVNASYNVWGYFLQLSDTGVIYGGVGNNTASWGYYKKSSVALDDDSIHHIAASFSNSDELRIYQDGEEVSGTLGGGSKPSTIGTSGNPLYISAQYGISSFSYGKGQKWDVRVYNRVLSANEIAEIYHHRGADKVWQGIVGWWRLDEAPSGTPAPLLIDSMDSTTGWTPANGTVSLNTTTKQEGTGSLSLSKTSTSYDFCYMYKSISSTNLTGQTLKVWVYIKDSATLAKINDLKLWFGQNSLNRYVYIYTDSLSVGWNAISVHVDDFSVYNGSPTKTDVRILYFTIDTINVTDTLSADDVLFDFYRAGDYVPNSIIDLSGNGNHGTPHGGTYQASPHRLRRGVLVS